MSIQISDKPYTPAGAEDDYYGTIRDNMSATSSNLKDHEKRLATAQYSVNTLGDRVTKLESVSAVRKGRGFMMFGDGTVVNWGRVSIPDSGVAFAKFHYPYIDTNYSISITPYSTYKLSARITDKGDDLCWFQVDPIPEVTVNKASHTFVTGVSFSGGENPSVSTSTATVEIPSVTVTKDPLSCEVQYVAFGRWKPHEAYDV